ncbi:phospholipase D family protein [Luteimonas sp. e5]
MAARRIGVQRGVLLFALALLGGCSTLPPQQSYEVMRIVEQARPQQLDCEREDRCAQPSPLLAQAEADAARTQAAADGGDIAGADASDTDDEATHRALLLEEGQDALRLRLHLIRAARENIDLQTYIFDEDDAGRVVLRELVGAARRGVRVRLLLDQLSAMRTARTLAALAGVHANFEVKVYNPVLGRGQMRWIDYALGTLCCFRTLNQRMHSKVLLIDERIGITGGRNYQDDYFDWDAEYNFRDRDIALSGPVVAEMAANFEAFWQSRRSVPVIELRDVARVLRREGVPELSRRAYRHPERARLMQASANDPEQLARLAAASQPVHGVEFVADLPQKHRREPREVRRAAAPSSDVLYQLVESTREEVLIQTPYLVLSRPAQQLFTQMRRREQPPRVVVSTNSLAATDAFMVYALSHKYKRRYLRTFGFEIYEYKPYPEDAPIDLVATRAPRVDSLGPPPEPVRQPWASRDRREYTLQRRLVFASRGSAAPLKRAGVRIGLHSKSLVVDDAVGVVGTHNFDPRGDHYNTESAVIIRDARFAAELATHIRRDIEPENSWVIAPRKRPPILSGLDYSLMKVSEQLPVFDLMPRRYATSYEFMPGPQCPTPLRITHEDFARCYRPVGDFPEVRIGVKWFATRLLTAFGAGLAPIL